MPEIFRIARIVVETLMSFKDWPLTNLTRTVPLILIMSLVWTEGENVGTKVGEKEGAEGDAVG